MNDTADTSRPVTLVRSHLESCGLHVLDQNWRHDVGQADLIAADRDVLIVCAVRVRTSSVRRDARDLPARKVRALRRLAVRWQDAHGTRYTQIRVDVAVVIQEGTGGYTIEHVQGAGER